MKIQKKYLIDLGVVLLLVGLAGYLYFCDPTLNISFKCPFHWVTGLDCPGCGMQRAVHAALHGHWAEAFHYNPFVICSIPYLIPMLLSAYSFIPGSAVMKKIFCNSTVMNIYAVLIVMWGILRNTPLIHYIS